jgi:hypothetical protein
MNPPCWAVITGELSGLVILDFDGERGNATMRKLGLDPHVHTGSGGHHVYFKHPGRPVPTVNSKTKRELDARFPGMDFRGDGGYAVFWGVNEKGPYEWLRDPVPDEPIDSLLKPPAAAPVERTNSEPHTMSANGRVEGERLIRAALDRVGSEGRNNAGFWLAAQLRDNAYSIGEAESALRNYRSRCPSTDTKGTHAPYTEGEMQASLKEAYSRPARDPWQRKPAREPVVPAEQPEPPEFSEETSQKPQTNTKPLATIDALTIFRNRQAADAGHRH